LTPNRSVSRFSYPTKGTPTMITKPMLSQEEVDYNKPEEHFIWALRNLPMMSGSGMMVFSGFVRGWSKHLWECGFAHRDYLAGLADEDGNIHVSKLPKQQIFFREAFRGPHHTYNNACRWVRDGEQDPEPVRIPNINQLTTQEQHALLYQFKEAGMIPDHKPKPSQAAVHYETEKP